MLQRIACLILLSFIPLLTFSQTPILDGLKQNLWQSTNNKDKLNYILALCNRHHSLSQDSLIKYIETGRKLTEKNSVENILLENYYANYVAKNGNSGLGLQIVDSMLKLSSVKNAADSIKLKLMSNKSGLLVRNGKSEEATDEIFQFLKLAESINDTAYIIYAYATLSWANLDLGNYNEGIKWGRKGISYITSRAHYCRFCSIYNNMSSCFNNLMELDSALHYVNIALDAAQCGEYLPIYANALNIRAAIYSGMSKSKEAALDLEEGIKVRKSIGDINYVIADMGQLSSFYATINETTKGIAIAKQGIQLAQQIKSVSKEIFVTKSLAENYQVAGMYPEYANTLKLIIDLKDTLYQNNTAEALADLQTKYELQKKENIIIQQENMMTRNHYVAYGVIVGIILVSILLGLLYRNRQLVRLRKMESELNQQKIQAAEAIKQAEENERKRIAADLHDNLGSFAASITSNVKHLREGKLDSTMLLDQLDDNAQNMVTQLSDTIWVLKNEHLQITKLADRFKVWMLRLMQNYPAIKYHYTENLVNDVEFTPAKILHIFLILKECVTNALKHSNATDLTIHFSSTDTWQISIADNGKGMSQSDFKNANYSNGLQNIQRRAEQNKWKVNWLTVDPHGTQIIISDSTTK